MADITMCTRDDCPRQDNCWRLNAPPNLYIQSYALFEISEETLDCDYYIPMDEIRLKE